jgi:putative DNA primase/helicase
MTGSSPCWAPVGEFFEVRDVASKTADNAARLATLFQVFEYGMEPISLSSFEAASIIIEWHLKESCRFLLELSLPVEVANAIRLDHWLVEYCKRHATCQVGKTYVRQNGPLRNVAALDDAIRELVEFDRIKLNRDEKPALVISQQRLHPFYVVKTKLGARGCYSCYTGPAK